ncbi:MAG TPA: ribosome small subunit-dependent GTPase A [Candidatus Pygmaiobacter gallistercoris]|nr:ribosome small subunit-dependent GTPase A [Candidatus Pygmaiobacter gallistercoris]
MAQQLQFENRIMKGIGGFYYVKTAEGLVTCKPKGIFRKRGISPLAGDLVTLETEQDSTVIAQIAPRKNALIRPPIANLDLLFVVAATVEPSPNYLVLDRMCAIALDKGITPVLVATKTDLADPEKFCDIYARSGIELLITAPDNTSALDRIRELICGKVCAFTGNSGVGKSTLLNRLIPQLDQQTGEISKKLGRGRHTTRQVELFEAFGGLIADTPGFSSLEMERANPILKENLQFCFPEFAPYLTACRFTGCSHRSEKGCAVRAAVESGEIHPQRYENYLLMYKDAEMVKEWERNER